jgi:hypothetical protein
MVETKVCKVCGDEKPVDEFYIVERLESSVRRNPRCKSCVKEYNRKQYAENADYKVKRKARQQEYMKDPEKVKAAALRSKKFYESMKGRALTLFKSATDRGDQYEEFDVTVEWIEEKLRDGVCEVTGIPFDFGKHSTYSKNPFAPSIDRKDSTKGYTKDNVRIVLWQVNLMRGEMTDEEVLEICKAVVKGLTNEPEMGVRFGDLPDHIHV